jgi:hypothetical protein
MEVKGVQHWKRVHALDAERSANVRYMPVRPLSCRPGYFRCDYAAVNTGKPVRDQERIAAELLDFNVGKVRRITLSASAVGATINATRNRTTRMALPWAFPQGTGLRYGREKAQGAFGKERPGYRRTREVVTPARRSTHVLH